ncbi:hypothetical protein MJ1HA_1234 [Metallosphaera sedula]|nr:hypothetical protein MJ1HA_1234 [Metallosphaera sedula]
MPRGRVFTFPDIFDELDGEDTRNLTLTWSYQNLLHPGRPVRSDEPSSRGERPREYYYTPTLHVLEVRFISSQG